MKFIETKIKDSFIVELEPIEDSRGFFARSFCRREFEAHGLDPCVNQCGVSVNPKKGTLRGMHYQDDPYAESKLIRCIRGAVYDVALDLRADSATFKEWVAVELSADNRRSVYIPAGCAHGFLTLEDDTEVAYQMSQFHMPDYARGVRWNDPAFGIVWPDKVRIISDKDREYPDFIP